ncbi:Hypothetical protein AT6N2_L0988 [Agrobacterium tumefaciens]|nr:Hypothetical protein AT6N2_L0988 [Agrobacterium tumefaciens]
MTVNPSKFGTGFVSWLAASWLETTWTMSMPSALSMLRFIVQDTLKTLSHNTNS